jgi:hypothetical protein
MNTALKLVGGLVLGAAIGAGVYILITKDSDEGILADLKNTINQAIEEGRRSAEERRMQLEQELGFSLEDPQAIPAASQVQPEAVPATPVTPQA